MKEAKAKTEQSKMMHIEKRRVPEIEGGKGYTGWDSKDERSLPSRHSLWCGHGLSSTETIHFSINIFSSYPCAFWNAHKSDFVCSFLLKMELLRKTMCMFVSVNKTLFGALLQWTFVQNKHVLICEKMFHPSKWLNLYQNNAIHRCSYRGELGSRNRSWELQILPPPWGQFGNLWPRLDSVY